MEKIKDKNLPKVWIHGNQLVSINIDIFIYVYIYKHIYIFIDMSINIDMKIVLCFYVSFLKEVKLKIFLCYGDILYIIL
jgi:hypothetical protein